MRTINSRLMHATFASAALVLAMTIAPPALAKGDRAITIRAVAVQNPTARTQAGAVAHWALMREAARALILRLAATAPVKSILPLGVVVDDGVPF